MTVGFFAGTAFFLVTPTGLLALAAGAFLVVRFTPVFAVARFLVAATSGTGSKTLGREFPVMRFSMDLDAKLRAGTLTRLATEIAIYSKDEPVADRVPSRAIVPY